MNTIKFEDLNQHNGILCAVKDRQFRIGDITFEAVEDKCDGLRSVLDQFKIVENIRPLFREPITIVRDEEYDCLFKLINKFGQVVLSVGTDDSNSYYPIFIFEFKPENLTTNVDIDKILNTITE